MEPNDMDNIFRQLDGHASPINADKLWAGIEPNLPQNAPRHRPFGMPLWFVGGAVGLLLVAGLYYYANQQTKASTHGAILAFASIQMPENANTPTISSTETELEKAIMEHAQSEVALISGSSRNTYPMPNALVELPNEGIRVRRGIVPAINQALVADPITSEVLTDFNQILPQTEFKPLETAQITEKTSENQVLSNKTLAQLPLVQPQLANQSRIPNIGKRPDPQTGCYDWGGGSRLRPYMGVYVGPHLTLRSMTARAREFEAWAAQRDATENKLEAVSAGAFFGVQAKNGLSIDAGFDFLRINEKLKAVTSRKDTIGQFVTVGTIVNAPGDTTFIRDSVFVTSTTTTTQTIYNKYSFYSIPVAIGYTFPTPGRLKPYVKAGAQIGISTAQKVGLLDATGQLQTYKSSQANTAAYPFRTKMGVSPFVQAGARFTISGALEAFGEVRYLHNTRDVTHDNFGVGQRYQLIGAQVGIRLGL
jgi:Outer membrane protein beta-barrel domain